MTREQFIQWLDEQIQETGSVYNDTDRLGQVRDGAIVRAKVFEECKAKFLTIEFDIQSNDTERSNEFTEGLEQ